MSKASKKYTELTLFKGDTNQDGAIFRMNEMKILMKAASELSGLQYQEDKASYALFGPAEKMHEGKEMVGAFSNKVLKKVDLCGFFSDAEIATKVQTVVKLAQENSLRCGADIIYMRSVDLLMGGIFSLKEWDI